MQKHSKHRNAENTGEIDLALARTSALFAADAALSVRIDGAFALEEIDGLPLEPNTIVPGNLITPEWRLMNSSKAPSSRKIAGNDAAGFRTSVYVNQEQKAVAGAYMERPFTPPTGVTQVVFEAQLQLPSGVVSSPAVVLQILDATETQVLATLSAVPTATLTTFSTAATTVVPGTEYKARIVFNSVGQANVLVNLIRVRPTTATGLFAANFVRIPVDDRTLQANVYSTWTNPRWHDQTPYSYVEIVTTATQIGIETYNSVGLQVFPPSDSYAIFIDGKFYTSVDPAIDRIDYNLVTLPAGTKRVRICGGPQITPGGGDSLYSNRGTFLAGIYVPATAALAAVPKQNNFDRWVVYGDSKLGGFYSSLPCRDGISECLRSENVEVTAQAVGGGALVLDVGTTLTVAACTPFAQKLAINRPTVIFVGIGRNDFTVASYTLANWTTQLGNLCDAIHAVLPSALVKLVKWTNETSEPNNGNGDTWNSWIAAMDTVASTRTTFVSVLQGNNLWTITDAALYTSDGVHPNDRGTALVASMIFNDFALWTPAYLTGLSMWWAGDLGLNAGAAMTAVVSSGTAPPAVTVSGVPAFAFELSIAITGAGALGAASFKWSVDAGRSWVQTGVLTAATVVLPNTGITVNFPAGAYSNDNVYVTNAQVGQATDQGPAGNNGVQASSAAQPPFTANGLIGKPGIKPNGVAAMQLTAVGVVLPQPYTIWVVGAFTSQATTRSFFGGGPGNDPILYSNSGTTMALNGGAQIAVTVDATITRLYECIMNGGSSKLTVNNGLASVTGNAGAATLPRLLIGLSNSGFKCDGPIHEMIVVDHAASAVEEGLVAAYIQHKYGIF